MAQFFDTAVIGLIVGVVTIGAVVVKITNSVAELRSSIVLLRAEIKHLAAQRDLEIENLKLLGNGIKERMEHINTRVSRDLKECTSATADIETFLVKTTSYEKRRNP